MKANDLRLEEAAARAGILAIERDCDFRPLNAERVDWVRQLVKCAEGIGAGWRGFVILDGEAAFVGGLDSVVNAVSGGRWPKEHESGSGVVHLYRISGEGASYAHVEAGHPEYAPLAAAALSVDMHAAAQRWASLQLEPPKPNTVAAPVPAESGISNPAQEDAIEAYLRGLRMPSPRTGAEAGGSSSARSPLDRAHVIAVENGMAAIASGKGPC
jgi:hypothetical protein